jgi:hypothetical protein
MDKFVLVSLYTDGEGEVYERQQQFQQDNFQTVALPFYAVFDSGWEAGRYVSRACLAIRKSSLNF